jgi:hypothetical protein
MQVIINIWFLVPHASSSVQIPPSVIGQPFFWFWAHWYDIVAHNTE